MLDENLKEFILNADSKALATMGDEGVNVVPVSTIFFINKKFILVDYFMNKTLKNILENKNISMVAWKGLSGYQIKADCEYYTNGDIFENIVTEVKNILPERVVKGILILNIKNIYDISVK